MPDVNTAIATGVTPPQLNPLQTLGQVAQVVGPINQNRLFQQEFQAKQALADAIRANTGADGQTDWQATMAALARDPRGAFAVPQLGADVLARRAAELGIDKAALDLSNARWARIGQELLPLLGKADLSKQDFYQAGGRLFGTGLFSDPTIRQEILTRIAELPNDPEALRQSIIGIYMPFHANEEGLRMMFGDTQMVDTGGAVNPVAVNRITGTTTPIGAAIPKTMTPGEAATPTPALVPNAQGGSTPVTMTREQFVEQARRGPIQVAPSLSASGLTPSEASQTVEVYDPATRQMVKIPREEFARRSGMAGAQGGPGGSGGPMAAAPPLGAPEAAAVTGRAGAEKGVELQNMADGVPGRKALLGNMLGSLAGFQPGPHSEFWRNIGALAAQYKVPLPGAPPTSAVAANEEFNKLAYQLAQAQFQALGGTGTDNKLESAMATSPNAALSRLGNEGIIALLKGNEDAIAAKNRAWQKWLGAGNGPESYGVFSTKFNDLYDPRVFQSQYMTPEAKRAMLAGMSADERKAFEASYKNAVRFGWVK